MFYNFYLDPLDVDLIINEQAIYLMSRYTEVRSIPIASKSSFLAEIHSNFENEKY